MLQRRRCRGRSNHDMELPFTIKNKHTNTATNQKLLHKRSITINNNNNNNKTTTTTTTNSTNYDTDTYCDTVLILILYKLFMITF